MRTASVVPLVAAFLEALAPPPDLRPSEWAEANVRIPADNALPGMIRFENAPYQREPLDLIADPTCRRISLMWGAQVGKTLTGLCAQGFRIDQAPTSQIMMQPSQGDLQTWLETKFNPMVEACPSLRAKIAKPRGRDGVNNQRMKSYPGGFIMFSWAGSAKTMRGRSAPLIVCDEVDGYDRTDEGHPVSLLWQRAATFGDRRKLLEISTPTIKGASYIEDAFEAGDRRRFHFRCRHCGEAQPQKWSQVHWEKADEDHAPETARYACLFCGVLLEDHERFAAIRRAEEEEAGWIAERPFKGHASFHLSELYSLFRRLPDIVESFLEKKAQGDLQTFVNVSLAETWEETGDKVDAEVLMKRAEPFAAEVPAGALVLTAGVDMQENRLELEVVGWGVGEESWTVDYKVLWGDVLQRDVWDELDEVLGSHWRHASGADMRIAASCLDTGGGKGMTQAAYDYASRKFGRRVYAIKGVGGWGRGIVERPKGKPVPGRPPLYSVGTDEAKLVVMRRLGLTEPGPGYCHLRDGLDPEWFAQVTAEQLVTRYVRGFPIREWHKTRPRNEAFDCRVYALAALRILNPRWAALAKRYAVDETPPAGSISYASMRAGDLNMQGDPAAVDESGAEGAETRPPAKAAPKSRRKTGRRKRGGWMAGG